MYNPFEDKINKIIGRNQSKLAQDRKIIKIGVNHLSDTGMVTNMGEHLVLIMKIF